MHRPILVLGERNARDRQGCKQAWLESCCRFAGGTILVDGAADRPQAAWPFPFQSEHHFCRIGRDQAPRFEEARTSLLCRLLGGVNARLRQRGCVVPDDVLAPAHAWVSAVCHLHPPHQPSRCSLMLIHAPSLIIRWSSTSMCNNSPAWIRALATSISSRLACF